MRRTAILSTTPRLAALVLTTHIAAACGGGGGVSVDTPSAPQPAVTSVTVAPAADSVVVGATKTFAASVAVTGGAAGTVTWSVANPAMASVAANGLTATVTGLSVGTTQVIATSTFNSARTGSATLTVNAAPGSPCVITGAAAGNIGLGQTIIGALTAADCKNPANGPYADVYRLTLAATQTVVIRNESDDFDAFLRLYNSAGVEIANDDDSGFGGDSRIQRLLTAGVYYISASSLSAGELGPYAVSVVVANICAIATTTSTITVGQTVNGTLATTDCTHANTDIPADYYRLTINAGQSITITMSSPTFDTYVYLIDANGNTVAEDDDSGGGTNSRLTRVLTAGTYYIAASAFERGLVGNYTLTVVSP